MLEKEFFIFVPVISAIEFLISKLHHIQWHKEQSASEKYELSIQRFTSESKNRKNGI